MASTELPASAGKENITVKRSARRRSIAIRLKNDGSAELLAPAAASDQQLAQALEKLRPWLIRQRQKLAALPEEAAVYNIEFAVGKKFFFLGRLYELSLQPGGNIISFRDEKLFTPSEDPAVIQTMLEAFYRRHARRIISSKLEKYTSFFGIDIKSISINGARRRFGSCSSNGELNFSWRLALYPEELIELVVLHELAHRREMNHSGEFYKVLASFLPDHRERNKRLTLWSRKLSNYP